MAISNYFVNLFGHSPIRPLQEHMSIVCNCVETLVPFFDKVFESNWEEAGKYQQKICDFEREADEIKRNLRLHLSKNILMPFSRTDVLELLGAQDSIANKARDVAGLIMGRKMKFPDSITQPTLQLFNRSIDASLQAKKVINELEEVFQSGFRGIETQIFQNMIKELDAIEGDTDVMQVEVRNKLFKIEQTLPPVDVIFLYKTIEWGGELANRAHRVGGRLLMLLA